jgi:hypothetical protein
MVLAWILQSLFPALLPPANGNGDDNDEYYAIMGLPKYSTPEKVRAAYKKLSLQLHPDKQQQRNGMEIAIAAARYEKVQEANHVLKDENKRRLYHEMRCNIQRYQFIEQGHLFHPGLVHHNLLQASYADKTRLLLFALFIMVGILLQPILIAIKLNRLDHNNDDDENDDSSFGSWLAILTPLWILLLCHWLVQLFVVVVVETSLCNVVSVLESAVWIVATMLFAYQLDDEDDEKSNDNDDNDHRGDNWIKVAAAVFVAIFLRLLHHVATLREIRNTQHKMVTVEYLHQVVKPAMAAERERQKSNNDDDKNNADDGEAGANDNDEEEEDDSANYIIVQPDDAKVLTVLGMLERPPDREELESLRVQTSIEYREAEQAADAVRRALVTWIVIYVPFAILVTLQLTNVIDTSWWIIFIPLWIRIAIRIAGNVFLCCCLVPPGTFPEDDDTKGAMGETAADNDGAAASPPDEPPTARYFSHPEAEMSAFGDWGSENLTSERINQVRRDEMGIDVVSAAETKQATNEPDGDIEQQQGAGGTEVQQQQQPVAPDANAKSEETASSSGTAATATANGSSSVERKNADHAEKGDAEEHDEEFGPSSSDDLEHLEEEYLQAKVQSCALSCTSCLELIVLCTIVGWLQTPGAYNAFWILFPIFCIAAIILAVVCCCIYARELPDIDVSGGTTRNNGGESEHDASAAAAAVATNKGDEENQQQQQPPPAEPIQAAAVGAGDGDQQQPQRSGAAPGTLTAGVVAEEGVVRPVNDSNNQETGDADNQKDPTNSYSEMDDLD